MVCDPTTEANVKAAIQGVDGTDTCLLSVGQVHGCKNIADVLKELKI